MDKEKLMQHVKHCANCLPVSRDRCCRCFSPDITHLVEYAGCGCISPVCCDCLHGMKARAEVEKDERSN